MLLDPPIPLLAAAAPKKFLYMPSVSGLTPAFPPRLPRLAIRLDGSPAKPRLLRWAIWTACWAAAREALDKELAVDELGGACSRE